MFDCGSDADCYNKGICNNGTCLCQLGWDHQSDCTGTYQVLTFSQHLVSIF